VPRQFGNNTIMISRHITVPFTVNAGGLAFGFCMPYLMVDSSTNLTTLGIQNNVAYDGATTFTGGAIGVATKYSITPNTVQTYRLVSSSMQIYSESSVLNQSGKIGGAVVPFSQFSIVAAGSAVIAATTTAVQTIANIENYDYYGEAQIGQLQGLRLCYYPQDVHDLELFNIDIEPIVANLYSETCFVFYITGAAASSTFNLELYLNYEVTPQPGSTISGMTTQNCSLDDPTLSIIKMKEEVTNVAGIMNAGGLGVNKVSYGNVVKPYVPISGYAHGKYFTTG